MAETLNKKWKGTTFGNEWMHQSLTKMIKVSDVRLFYVFTAIFIIPVYMIIGNGFRFSYNFYRRHLGKNKLDSFFLTYRNLYNFSKVVIDKFAMSAGKQFEIIVDGYDIFLKRHRQQESVIQFSSHIGNYEIAGFSLNSELKHINAVVFGGEKASVMKAREKLLGKHNMTIIPIKEGVDHIFLMDQALQRGEAVSIAADRCFDTAKKINVNFFGEKAPLSAGPFRLATIREADVIAINVMKTAWNTYHIYVSELQYDKNAPKKIQVEELADLYAKEIEKMIKLYPEQWYNFYDFWQN